MNPKLSGQEARGGGFIKKETLLLINDDLTIQPLSPINGILDLDKLKVLVSNSEEHEVEVREEEVHLNLFLHRHHTHIYAFNCVYQDIYICIQLLNIPLYTISY